jgi:hypothetical protein
MLRKATRRRRSRNVNVSTECATVNNDAMLDPDTAVARFHHGRTNIQTHRSQAWDD